MNDRPDIRLLDRSTPPHILTLILLAGIAALAMNIFLPSLPGMTAYFETEYRLMQLSVAVYLAVNAGLQLVIGPISDKLGRRPVILGGIAIFLLATLGCILAPNAYVFLAFRMMQATIVVAMVLSRAVVRDMVPQDQAASMIGYVTMGMAVVPMIGPAIGGVLDEIFGWKANFWMLFALGVLILWLTWTDLGETARTSGHSLSRQFREYPELLTSPRFWGYALASGLASGAFFAYLGGAPFVGTQVFGLQPAELGLFFGAPAVGYFLGNFISGRYSVRFGVNRMVYWGTVINSVGIILNLVLFYAGVGSAISFFGLMTFVGLGNGMSIPNATAGALSVALAMLGFAISAEIARNEAELRRGQAGPALEGAAEVAHFGEAQQVRDLADGDLGVLDIALGQVAGELRQLGDELFLEFCFLTIEVAEQEIRVDAAHLLAHEFRRATAGEYDLAHGHAVVVLGVGVAETVSQAGPVIRLDMGNAVLGATDLGAKGEFRFRGRIRLVRVTPVAVGGVTASSEGGESEGEAERTVHGESLLSGDDNLMQPVCGRQATWVLRRGCYAGFLRKRETCYR